ncbi:RES family NAD+ phosphorylase [Steroidobacter sp. S1-65]|uniref:RES family NAD+ phosphorylase n=1 Tax=Steroidobacter gossypii TaxID=2805490 RepID=A0ABS1X1B2_9GAMM|nr:RES family NAD+ phosphorylase [Steroidobacter gossypii]MBM0107030.1 RES family NAD+ phosphorylase [Steroidobacter gossypii]
MSAGSKGGPDSYSILPKGTKLWHVYPQSYGSVEFNPKSKNRFATPPPPDCAMFYAGDSSACALWEAVLRNLVIEDSQPQHIDPDVLNKRSIVELEVTQATKILDLRSPHFRKLTSDCARHTQWQELAIVPEPRYPETHAEARILRATWAEAMGLRWFSRQIGAQSTYVFYRPPHASGCFREVRSHALDTPEGWALIDAALRVVGVERLGARALAAELEPELPP